MIRCVNGILLCSRFIKYIFLLYDPQRIKTSQKELIKVSYFKYACMTFLNSSIIHWMNFHVVVFNELHSHFSMHINFARFKQHWFVTPENKLCGTFIFSWGSGRWVFYKTDWHDRKIWVFKENFWKINHACIEGMQTHL